MIDKINTKILDERKPTLSGYVGIGFLITDM